MLLIEQKPENSFLWVQVPPVAALSERDIIYPEVCRAILDLFRKAPTLENVDRAIKACLLKPGAIDTAELPLDLLLPERNPLAMISPGRARILVTTSRCCMALGDANKSLDRATVERF